MDKGKKSFLEGGLGSNTLQITREEIWQLFQKGKGS
jgi:hypothetical protein